MFNENRRDPREALELPVKLGDMNAMTRDVSSSGMYIHWVGSDPVGGIVQIEMEIAEAQMRLAAVGEIVRVEHNDGRTGIGVRLIEPRLEPI